MALLMLCCVMFGCVKEPGSIYGVVTDFSSNEPVAGANVQLRPSGETTLTGSDGMYEILEVPNGDYSITVSKAGYTDLVDDYVITVKNGKKVRRDVQIKPLPASLHIYDNDSHEISELDFGADEGVVKKTFNIFNEGTRKINFEIEKSANWITNINPSAGTIDFGATKPIVVTIDRKLLAIGDNTTTLLITSSADGGKELIVKARNNGASPTVSISEAIAIDSVTYRIKCEVVSGGGLEVTERGICWNTYGDPAMEDEKIQFESGGVGQYTIRMENLSMATHYYVKAYAKNEYGIGLSEALDFVTGAVITPPSVTTVEVKDVTATSAIVKGNVTDDGGTDIIERGVCWGTNANPITSGHHQAASGTTTGLFSVSITGLTSNTTYHVRAYAKNSRGTSYGQDLSFTTTEGLSTVTTANVTNITATSAKGGGTVTDQGASAVTERGICWSTSHNPTVSDSHANSGTGVGTFTVNMTGLTPNETYYVRAYAKNQQGTAYGSEVSFKALEGLPVVTTSNITDITATTAKGGGNVTDQGGSAVTERGVCWSADPNPTIIDSHANSSSGTGSFTLNITGLMPGTKYYVCAYAINTQGTAYGEQKEFTTKANKPTVTTATLTDITPTTATGGGEVTDNGGAEVTERGVCWSTSHSPTISSSHAASGTDSDVFTVNITGLTPSTTYYVKAYAKNSAGTGYGNEMAFVTEALPIYTVSVSAEPSGCGTVTGGGNYQQGQSCTVIATPATGYAFLRWTKDGSPVSNNANYTFTVEENCALVAHFQKASYTIAVSANPSNCGTVAGGGTFEYGESCTVTATANAGFEFVRWTENGIPVSTDATYTFTVNGNRTLVAQFQIKTYTITTSSNPSEGGTTSGGGSYQNGQLCTVTATANTGYDFTEWTENGTSVSTNASYTFPVVGDRTLVANFTPKTYTINVSASPTNGGVVSGGGNYTYGQSCTLTATPASGFNFVRWTENGTQVSTDANYTFQVTSNRTLVAHFTNAPIGSIDALFTVGPNDSDKVYFSQGNLQYIGSSNTWKFADNQWDVIGDTQGNDQQGTTRDLFGWGTSGYVHGANCYQPWSTSQNNNDYWAYGNYTYNLYDQSGMADWGYNAITNGGNQENTGWRTLTTNEWVYVFNTRTTTSGIRYAKARVNGVNGVILVPDDWSTSSFTLLSTNSASTSFATNTINETTWNMYLAPFGCVFLPAAGYRYGTSVSIVGSYGGYWSASYDDEGNAYNVWFNDLSLPPQYSNYRDSGRSVRLVRSAQ